MAICDAWRGEKKLHLHTDELSVNMYCAKKKKGLIHDFICKTLFFKYCECSRENKAARVDFKTWLRENNAVV